MAVIYHHLPRGRSRLGDICAEIFAEGNRPNPIVQFVTPFSFREREFFIPSIPQKSGRLFDSKTPGKKEPFFYRVLEDRAQYPLFELTRPNSLFECFLKKYFIF